MSLSVDGSKRATRTQLGVDLTPPGSPRLDATHETLCFHLEGACASTAHRAVASLKKRITSLRSPFEREAVSLSLSLSFRRRFARESERERELALHRSNVERANALAAVHSWVSVSFVEGSFTSLPEAVLAQAPFDFVWAQVSLCHAHPFLDQIFEQVKLVLAPGGRFVVNDFLGGEAAPSAATRDHVYKRLHLESLRGPRAWRAAADGAGLSLLKYEQLDRHLAHAYGEMERLARQAGITSADGTLLADNYKESVAATRRGDIGMNLALYELRLE